MTALLLQQDIFAHNLSQVLLKCFHQNEQKKKFPLTNIFKLFQYLVSIIFHIYVVLCWYQSVTKNS